jgi:hypothetical protein
VISGEYKANVVIRWIFRPGDKHGGKCAGGDFLRATGRANEEISVNWINDQLMQTINSMILPYDSRKGTRSGNHR